MLLLVSTFKFISARVANIPSCIYAVLFVRGMCGIFLLAVRVLNVV